MALRGIDAQIMVVRAAELSTTQVKEMRRHDTAQSQFAAQLKAESEKDRNKPIAAVRVEPGKIDVNARGGNPRDGKKKKSKETGVTDYSEPVPEGGEIKNLPVTPSEHRLDIKI